MTQADRISPQPRTAFPHFLTLQTRWSDNDAYGHVNNAVYYHLVDSVVNRYLIDNGVLDIANSDVVGLVVDTRCSYFSPLVFPQDIDAGLRVARAGRSSITYEIGLFANGADTTAAFAHFVHVYVDRATRRPVALPEALRTAIAELQAR